MVKAYKKLSILLVLTLIVGLMLPVAAFADGVTLTINGQGNDVRKAFTAGENVTIETDVQSQIWVKENGVYSWKGVSAPEQPVVLENVQPGAYVVDAYAVESDAFARSVFFVGSSVDFTAEYADGKLTITAEAANIANPYYQFWVDPTPGTPEDWRAFGNADAQGYEGYYGTAATQTLDVEPGKEYVIAVYAKDENGRSTWQDAVAVSKRVTAALTVESVSAITENVFNNTADQVLEFAINGESEAADLVALEKAGYTVTFLTNKDVLDDGNGNKVNTNTTGAVLQGDFLGSNISSFEYQVVVSKDGVDVATSETKSVNVLNGSDIATIDKVTLTIDADVVVNSGIIEMNDKTPTLDAVEGTLVDGKTEQPIAGESFESLNKTVALIDSSGRITPVSEGQVTFKITAGNAVKEVTYTVVDDANDRYVSNVTAGKASIDMTTASSGIDVILTLKDQFGDPIKADLSEIVAVQNENNEDITLSVDPVAATIDSEGNATVTITVKPEGTNTGQGTLLVKDNDQTLLTIPVTVGDGSAVAYRVLETTAQDNVIDAKPGATDNQIVLNYNQYNDQGQFIAKETDIEDAIDYSTETYKVVSSDDEVASVLVENGDITVKAEAEGTATIKIMEGALTRATYEVQVINTTPVLTSVTFDDTAAITEAGAYSLSNVITEIKDENGNDLYLQNDGTVNTKVDGSGLTVGEVSFVTVDWASVELDDSGNIIYGESGTETDPAINDSGTIIIKVLNASNETVGLYELTVDVQ
ncbi:hypothetical protein JOC37_000074 [Desulfohalotomaculum tongense]|uniref:hypothetical protein n=1 Tax=Desulforadius tongensis TaxID=1216062 RepID=UPI00195B434A|nr:hypothetical protein [Desulforadius tongensis]MBM7853709.1 hypothetical protein [Desulforadius tongensis]